MEERNYKESIKPLFMSFLLGFIQYPLGFVLVVTHRKS